jgi:hypothetical protein
MNPNCTCSSSTQISSSCFVHGLLKFTDHHDIYDKAHLQANVFGSGYIRVRPSGKVENVSIKEVFEHVSFVQENRIPDAKDPCE